MTEHVGQRFGNYQLLQKLGQGGFADVYLARHSYLQSLAAVKLLHAQLGSNNLESFLHEARILVELKHPHILQVLDFGEEQGTPYLVMTYAEHGTLRQRYPRGRILPLSLVCLYIEQAASALQYAHEHRIIHRDIKPENLLLDRADTLLLSDFGIALPSQSSYRQSDTSFAGTAEYMAPEQLQGMPRRASDQYALAIVAYEWLTGETPFHGTFKEIGSQHLFKAPPALRGKDPRIIPEVEEVILRALNKEPEARFATIEEFAHALTTAAGSAMTIPTAFQGSMQWSRNSSPFELDERDQLPQWMHKSLPPTVAARYQALPSTYPKTERAPEITSIQEKSEEDEENKGPKALVPAMRRDIIKNIVASFDKFDYDLIRVEEEDVRVGLISFTCWLSVFAFLLGVSACVRIFFASSLWPVEAITLAGLNLVIAPSAYLSTRHRIRTILLLIGMNALVSVFPSSLYGPRITNISQIFSCLTAGFVVGVLIVGSYATVVYPLFPRGYLLPHLPRVIGYYILMAVLWGALWIGGGYFGLPAFVAQHFLACLWSMIAWTGIAILSSAKFG